tara:strand:- start:301 stop:594 length:294 start_codon:yes stop_codon:yes gene_type:complete
VRAPRVRVTESRGQDGLERFTGVLAAARAAHICGLLPVPLAAIVKDSRPEGLPHLARMARQWLGCPATSAGVERLLLFSKVGSMHHDLKGAMEDGSL